MSKRQKKTIKRMMKAFINCKVSISDDAIDMKIKLYKSLLKARYK
jgi:hypothetical protein